MWYRTIFGLLIASWLTATTADAQRETIVLSDGWRFALDSQSVGIVHRWPEQGLPAGLGRGVSVPHTWNVDPGSEDFSGAGWYEELVSIPASWKGRSVRIQFDAVYHSAIVWVNGRKAGEHLGAGYTRFTFDVTDLLRPGETNRILVRADNSYSRQSIPFLRSFDWPKDGGIIRPVSLIATSRPGIEGVRVRPRIMSGSAENPGTGSVEIEVRFLPGEIADGEAASIALILQEDTEPDSKIVLKREYSPTVEDGRARIECQLDSVRLWHPDSPFIYAAAVEVRKNGTPVDRMIAPFGFREIRVAGNRILLNGEPVRLMGVEWMPGSTVGRGMAESYEDLRGMLRKLRSMNALFTRFHWQQDDALFDWCDRHGVLVQEEVPFWGPGTPLNDTLMAIGRMHLTEMIRDHYNHPSIVMWGVGNELASREKAVIDSVGVLYRFAKRLDDTRLVNYVSNQLAWAGGMDASGAGDVLMFNEYQDTWFLDDPARIGALVDSISRDYPEKPLVISEYGLCEPANQGGDERRARDLVYHTAVLESKPAVAGAIYFCLNDYRTHMGEEGSGALRQRVHGVFDISGNPKPSSEVLRQLSSPVELLNVGWNTGHKLEVVLIASQGLPSYSIRGYRLIWSDPAQGTITGGTSVAIPPLRPGEKIHIPCDSSFNGKIRATVIRPGGEIVLQRDFIAPY